MRFAILPTGSIILPPLPVWPAGDRYRVTVGASALLEQLRRYSPALRVGAMKDQNFVLVPPLTLQAAIVWTMRSLAAQDIAYLAEAFDCEDFVNELDMTLRKMAARAGIKAAPLTCCLSVAQENAWARVPAGGLHAVAAVLTDTGPVIVEQQSGMTAPLESYPNRTTMLNADNF